MAETQKATIELWNDAVSTLSTDTLPADLMPVVRARIEADVRSLLTSPGWYIDYLESLLRRLEPHDPLLDIAIRTIAGERAVRRAEGPVERAGRQAMFDANDLSVMEVALRWDELRVNLQALAPSSPVRIEGERRLAHRRLAATLRKRMLSGQAPWPDGPPNAEAEKQVIMRLSSVKRTHERLGHAYEAGVLIDALEMIEQLQRARDQAVAASNSPVDLDRQTRGG